MPTQNSNSRLKTVISDLENGGDAAGSVPLSEEVEKLVSEEIDFYKKEGKL